MYKENHAFTSYFSKQEKEQSLEQVLKHQFEVVKQYYFCLYLGHIGKYDIRGILFLF